MLMQYGPVTFEVWPLNPTDYTHQTAAGWVEKPVLGRRPTLEFVGDNSESHTINCTLFPEKFGGLSSLSALAAIRESGMPHFLMRGDGTPLGWFSLMQVRERSRYLDSKGVGQVIEVELQMTRADAPGAEGYMSSLLSLMS